MLGKYHGTRSSKQSLVKIWSDADSVWCCFKSCKCCYGSWFTGGIMELWIYIFAIFSLDFLGFVFFQIPEKVLIG